MKIAKYGLDNWVDLAGIYSHGHCKTTTEAVLTPVQSLHENGGITAKQSHFSDRQDLSRRERTVLQPERADGHQKWVDFVMTFWHCDCICRVSEKAFTERYQKWCKRKGYHFSTEKALDLYAGSCGHFTTLPKNDNTKLLITTAAQQLLAGKMTLAALRAEMTRLAMQLPEYNTVRAMYGVGETTAAQLMAEIGDVRRFPRRSSIVGFAGVDPGVDDSGKHSAKSVPTTKRGSPHLRKTLYQIVCTYLRKAPANELVYQFLEKKRAEGKPYFVYMTAAQNKFLRIYYARVRNALRHLTRSRIPRKAESTNYSIQVGEGILLRSALLLPIFALRNCGAFFISGLDFCLQDSCQTDIQIRVPLYYNRNGEKINAAHPVNGKIAL